MSHLDPDRAAIQGVGVPSKEPSVERMRPIEVAWGWVPGHEATERGATPGSEEDPITALENVMRPALERRPCVVQFSGGRDSSLVLAVAVGLSRREGLPIPVARTQRFPGLDETAETHWQEEVIRHLQVDDWERVDVSDELDLVGPVAGPSLRRHGMLWPPMIHTHHFDWAAVGGGAVLDGEGGDEVLGPGRMAPVRALVAGLAAPTRHNLKHAAFASAPRFVRQTVARHLYRRKLRPPWLREQAWRDLEKALAADFAREPWDRRRALRQHGRLRSVAMFRRNSTALAAEHDVVTVHPLLESPVVASLAAAAGPLGFAGRTTAMTELFSDLLPGEVLRRSGKARFNRVAFNMHSRAFATEWDGTGVDEDVVDAEALQREWRSEEPSALSFGLLQSAWLASAGECAP